MLNYWPDSLVVELFVHVEVAGVRFPVGPFSNNYKP